MSQMIGFTLGIAMHFYSGEYKESITQHLDKKQCIAGAHQFYREYWSGAGHKYYTADAICTNSINKFDYVDVYCDKNNSCHEY